MVVPKVIMNNRRKEFGHSSYLNLKRAKTKVPFPQQINFCKTHPAHLNHFVSQFLSFFAILFYGLCYILLAFPFSNGFLFIGV